MAATQDAQELFNSHDSAVAPLGLVVTEGARELGEKINAHLVSWATPDNNPRGTFLVENECPRFSSGDSKGLIRSSIRGDDLFFLVDVEITAVLISCSANKTLCPLTTTFRILSV